jgi:hypothetical protein
MVTLTRAQAKISLVLADVDGTLVTAEKVLTSRARAAVKALQAAAILHDDTGAEKPHTGNHIGDDLGSPGVAVEVHTNVSERGGADSNQCVRSQPAASPRYCRSAPIRVPRTNAAKTLMSVSTKSLTLNVCRNAMSDGPFDAL